MLNGCSTSVDAAVNRPTLEVIGITGLNRADMGRLCWCGRCHLAHPCRRACSACCGLTLDTGKGLRVAIKQVWDDPGTPILLKPEVRVNHLIYLWIRHGVLWIQAGHVLACTLNLCRTKGLAVTKPVVSAQEVPQGNLSCIEHLHNALLLSWVGRVPAHHGGWLTGGSGG